MAALDEFIRGITSNVRAAQRGILLQPQAEYLVLPQEQVLREAVDPRRAREAVEYLGQSIEPDLIPASTVASGALGPEGPASLLLAVAMRQVAPDFAKDVHNLAAFTPNQLTAIWGGLAGDGPLPDAVSKYLKDIGGLYTVGTRNRAIEAGAKGTEVPLDVLSLFEPEDIRGISQAMREIALRNLVRSGVNLDDELLLFRNPNFLVDAPGRTAGTLSFTRTPAVLAEAYGRPYESFFPYTTLARNIRTDVPAMTSVQSARYNPGWLGESEVQVLAPQVKPYTFTQLAGLIDRYGSIEDMLRAQRKFGTDPYLANLPGMSRWTGEQNLDEVLGLG